jgi:hypothetical protein
MSIRERRGVAMILLGIGISVFGYVNAMPGGTYTVPLGTIIYGMILLFGD